MDIDPIRLGSSSQRQGDSLVPRLARLGFADPAAASRLLTGAVLAELTADARYLDAVLAGLGTAADPSAGLAGLERVAAASAPDRDDLFAAVRADDRFRARLLHVLGASIALGDHLARHPEHWRVLADDAIDATRPTAAGLRRELLSAVGADPEAAVPVATGTFAAGADALRIAYSRAVLRLGARDIAGGLDVLDVAAELADLAAGTLEAALALARATLPPDAAPCRLAVIGMGKCGGRELNYASDVDVIFVAEPVAGADEQAALASAARLAGGVVRACSDTTREGTIWPVDTALRPEGAAGPLARTLASHRSYYQRWARTWEFQALLKARPVAGDLGLGHDYIAAMTPMVWQAAGRDGFVEDVQVMRRRVVAHIPSAQAGRQLKLGPGGLRDIEFAVQLLQLVHGRTDETIRSGTTVRALQALVDGGYVGRDDGAKLVDAYRFLRTLEHRLQLWRLRRTHVVPDSEVDQRRLGRALGYRTDPVAELNQQWRLHGREVRRLHEKLFYRPLLAAVARLPGEEARLTPEASRSRLDALGFADPAGALRHLEALTSGVGRAAAIQRTLLPVMLGWFAESADPDAGLLGFRRVSEALGATHWYLRVLRDEGAAAERLARLLGASRLTTELLLRAPETVGMLGVEESLTPRTRAELDTELGAAVARANGTDAAVLSVRATRRRELFRIAASDVLGLVDVDAVGAGLTALTGATLSAGLRIATATVERVRRGTLPCRLAVIGMGRLGGHEQSYGSDADVMFVYEPLAGPDDVIADDDGTDATSGSEAADAAHAVAAELRRILSVPGTEPGLTVDAGLRPEGQQGPLVRTLAAYAGYYARWSHGWETQALLRAEPVAGDATLGDRFIALVDELRWPRAGLPVEAAREIRRIKARVEAERLPRGADPRRHTKLGPGGLADVEWTVQLMQLRHAYDVPALRTTRTLLALDAASAAGLVTTSDARALAHAWRLASRVRNAIMLARGRPDDLVPTDPRELDRVARLSGYGSGEAQRLVEDYLRITRRARSVVERVFYG